MPAAAWAGWRGPPAHRREVGAAADELKPHGVEAHFVAVKQPAGAGQPLAVDVRAVARAQILQPDQALVAAEACVPARDMILVDHHVIVFAAADVAEIVDGPLAAAIGRYQVPGVGFRRVHQHRVNARRGLTHLQPIAGHQAHGRRQITAVDPQTGFRQRQRPGAAVGHFDAHVVVEHVFAGEQDVVVQMTPQRHMVRHRDAIALDIKKVPDIRGLRHLLPIDS
ncbi:MAG: hypothetical protein U5Q16_07665 [Gammaproteobacteria bacterium]|nr:hypothetical protein [Gammaproteobacteria bacterium]